MSSKNEIPYSQELLRKAIHLISLSIPLIYIIVSRETALWILIPLMIVIILIDILGKFYPPFAKIFNFLFGRLLREHEIRNKVVLNGASWVMISAVICVSIFPKIVFISGFCILIISDISAALIGRKFGKTPFLDKSLEGTTAFIISAILVIIVIGIINSLPVYYYIFGFIGAIAGGLVEGASVRLRVDDNLSIPLSICIILSIGGIVSEIFHSPFLNLLH